MKRLVFTLAFLGISIIGFSQSFSSMYLNNIPQNNKKPIVYYSIPKTEVVFEIKVEKAIRSRGVYSQSAHLLGLKNVITKDEIKYKIKDIKICSKPISNPNNQFAMIIGKGVSVEKSEFNTLENIIIGEHKTKEVLNLNQEKISSKTEVNNSSSIEVKPIIVKELLKDGKLEKITLNPAEVVEKINLLRERQIEILSGQIEGTYINTTVDFMYKQLDEIIETYYSLFTGVETIEEEVFYYSLVPEKPIIPEEDLMLKLCRFSEINGLSSAEIQNNDPIVMVKFSTNNFTKSIGNYESSKENSASNNSSKNIGIYYSIPEKVKVSIEINNRVYQSILDINQFGVISTMNSIKSNIKFNPNYGSIESIY